MNVAVARIGHNKPPFDLSKELIESLYEEAKNWCDGDPIENQQQADMVQKLLRDIQAAEKEADQRRKEEQEPFKTEIDAIQARYNELIGNNKSVKGLTVRAIEACKAALAPWLKKVDEENRRRAEEARKEAEEKQRAAMEAMRQRQSLEDSERAEQAVREAKEAEAEARRLANARASAKGAGRAVTLRDYYEPEIVSETEFARYLWTAHREMMADFLNGAAVKLVAAGVHKMPGVVVHHDRRPV